MPILYCRPEEAPIIEAALADAGYSVQIPWKYTPQGASLMLLTKRATSVLMSHVAGNPWAQLEVWGATPNAAIDLLGKLPITLIPATIEFERMVG